VIDDNTALVREILAEGWNRGNFIVAARLVPSDYQGHGSHEIHGAEAYQRFITEQCAAFPEIHSTIKDQIPEGDTMLTRWTAHATHMGRFAGIAPTGKQALGAGITVLRIAGGKAAECWTNADGLGLMRQLGAVQLPVPTGRQTEG
jgi:predicted ester cyclase